MIFSFDYVSTFIQSRGTQSPEKIFWLELRARESRTNKNTRYLIKKKKKECNFSVWKSVLMAHKRNRRNTDMRSVHQFSFYTLQHPIDQDTARQKQESKAYGLRTEWEQGCCGLRRTNRWCVCNCRYLFISSGRWCRCGSRLMSFVLHTSQKTVCICIGRVGSRVYTRCGNNDLLRLTTSLPPDWCNRNMGMGKCAFEILNAFACKSLDVLKEKAFGMMGADLQVRLHSKTSCSS